MEGAGLSEASCEDQVVVSFEMKVVSFACGAVDAACGERREIVSILEMPGFAIRALRMWLPCFCVISFLLNLRTARYLPPCRWHRSTRHLPCYLLYSQ